MQFLILWRNKMKKFFYFYTNQMIDENRNNGKYILFNGNEECYSQVSKNIANIIYSHIKKGTQFTSWNYIDNKSNELFFKNNIHIKDHCGIYFLFLDSELRYIGSSTDIFRRIANDHSNSNIKFNQWNFFPCNKNDMKLVESICIIKFKPTDNKCLPDNPMWISHDKLKRIKKNLDDDFLRKTNIQVRNKIYYEVDEVIKSLTRNLEKFKNNNILISKKSIEALKIPDVIKELLNHEIIKKTKVFYQLFDVVASMQRSYSNAIKVKKLVKDMNDD